MSRSGVGEVLESDLDHLGVTMVEESEVRERMPAPEVAWVAAAGPSEGVQSGAEERPSIASVLLDRLGALNRLAWLAVKRVVDLVVALCGLVVLMPLMIVLAIAIKLDSPGPVFFIHKRPGRGGRLFRIFKFRTMLLDSEQQFKRLSPEQRREFAHYGKVKSDPRITRVGRFLRRTSLDELPQLINVLLGDMSLIGPRPYLRSQMPQIPRAQRRRLLSMRPGLSGWWQVNGRNLIPFEQRLEMDLYYIENWTPWLDLKILVRTPLVMLTGRGAF